MLDKKEVENEKSYLLMSKVSGVMSCDTYYLDHPQILLDALATGLKMLWQVDVSDCPVIRDVDIVLEEARLQIVNGLVDFCLPNVFLEDAQIRGFIDLGRTGVGDKWNDIALCYRSLKHNFDGTYGGKVYDEFNPDVLFEKLDIKPDWEKINWYLLLDELF